jgi:hypothetical protein
VAQKQLRHALITRYKKLATDKGIDSNINIHIEQWAADSLIESYTLDTCYELLDYYFRISETPSWKWFANNADKLYKNLHGKREDDRIRSILKQQAKEWLNK